jgi:glutamate synthase (NADPH/NADH) large chain
MSGGIAYVYDVKGNFESLCNKEMVDLDPVGDDDKAELLGLIKNHFDYTKSSVAKFVIDDFESQLKNFVKVFPKDYKKVLAKKKDKVVVEK